MFLPCINTFDHCELAILKNWVFLSQPFWILFKKKILLHSFENESKFIGQWERRISNIMECDTFYLVYVPDFILSEPEFTFFFWIFFYISRFQIFPYPIEETCDFCVRRWFTNTTWSWTKADNSNLIIRPVHCCKNQRSSRVSLTWIFT